MSDVLLKSPVVVKFDGVVLDTWHTVELAESVDDLCAALRLGVAMPGVGSDLGLTPNTVVTVWADDELLATVRTDRRTRRIAATSHDVDIEARSLGRELVDTQYSATYSGLLLGEIAARLCAAFNVPLKVEGGTATVREFGMQCEQPANALLNAARTANKLMYPTADGGLMMTEPTSSAAVATIVYGETIKGYSVVEEDRLRFSEYRVKAFDYGAQTDGARKGVALDKGITFFRPMHIVGDRMGQSDGGCGRRAELERNRRLARARRIELEVPGWHYMDEAGKPRVWRVNTQVRVVIAPEGIDQVLLVGDRTLKYDAQGGRMTRMVLMERTAFVGDFATARRKRGAGPAKGGRQ